MPDLSHLSPSPARRDFLKLSGAALLGAPLAGRAGAPGLAPAPGRARGNETLKVGLIGCGGRGTGAAAQALSTAGNVELTALGDVFGDRIERCLKSLRDPQQVVAGKLRVEGACFTGFDAYQKVLDSGVDVVILAGPPHFRPEHFRAAIAAGKHVFLEKPVAVDGPGVRTVLAAAAEAKRQNLSVVCGLQRHYENGYVETMRRVHEGAIGEVVAARCYWNMGSLWMNPRRKEWSDMEWQLRNWLYFTWLSGDHIVEQHVHNLDVVCWAKQAWPVRCHGVGGRQVRTDPAFGHIYDHHAVHYQFADGSWMCSMCRQIDGCWDSVSEHLIGTKGKADLASGSWSIDAGERWVYGGEKNNPYQTEHDVLFDSIRRGLGRNDGELVANSTLAAVMGRMATYSGRVVEWRRALESSERLGPASYELGELAVAPVAMPGRKA